jgi:hypothetical protein
MHPYGVLTCLLRFMTVVRHDVSHLNNYGMRRGQGTHRRDKLEILCERIILSPDNAVNAGLLRFYVT